MPSSQTRTNSGSRNYRNYDRNVRIGFDDLSNHGTSLGSNASLPVSAPNIRRPKRIISQPKRLNTGGLQCPKCNKKCRLDADILKYYSGNIACSFACFKKT